MMPDTEFEPTSLDTPSLYNHAERPPFITVRRLDLERCIRTYIEKTMCWGGDITELARDCMIALDNAEMNED